MAKWIILNIARDDDDTWPWLLLRDSGDGIPDPIGRYPTLAIAKKSRDAREWQEALEAGRMSIPTKRKPAAPKSGSKPKAPARARRK